ncbi:uncharacterized protein PHALS_01835 [Plasmopara halstedii]|uniref:Uncharacterized protein n=1 Tax=Plasmopara halstedii TaxID=4781 RepID=A0A0P1ATD9_PLAHL|nr:uncharacterized protein PHALS_01835 [Plasmopara halstedii]CEG45546.1 hypothetical protein PHALS_01835 [Plasmopara halstedii]|eukprot:XP_024581915.1 hypothetical protein PHALS_01835 [Plasmopara halstedii]
MTNEEALNGVSNLRSIKSDQIYHHTKCKNIEVNVGFDVKVNCRAHRQPLDNDVCGTQRSGTGACLVAWYAVIFTQ